MLRYLFALPIAALVLVTQANTTLHAQTTSAQDQERLSTLTDMRKSVVRSIGATDQAVEVIVERNVLIVLRVNSNMNESTHAGRDNEATAIASIASKAISGKVAFKDVVSLQVRYVIRKGSSDKAIDTVEFREDTNGVFQHHQT
jgi:hypothetical protein